MFCFGLTRNLSSQLHCSFYQSAEILNQVQHDVVIRNQVQHDAWMRKTTLVAETLEAIWVLLKRPNRIFR
jgi:hypothetical protein